MRLQSWTGWTKWNGNIDKTFTDAQKAAAGELSIAEFRLKAPQADSHGVLDVYTLAEKAAPGMTLVDVQMIGAAGRLYLSGQTAEVTAARERIEAVLAGIGGRDA